MTVFEYGTRVVNLRHVVTAALQHQPFVAAVPEITKTFGGASIFAPGSEAVEEAWVITLNYVDGSFGGFPYTDEQLARTMYATIVEALDAL